MIRRPALIAIGLAVTGAPAAFADTPARQTEQRPLEQVESRYARDELAHAWGLTTQEAERYEVLMRGPRGAFSVPSISPIEVLGIHADTPAERRQYAERLVRLLYEDTERVLAFERATQAAWQRLGRPMFDPAQLQTRKIGGLSETRDLWGKRLALFVARRDCPRCTATTRKLVNLAGDKGPLSGLDIYVVDTRDAEAIRAFARGAGVAPESVTRRRITLNQGETLFRQYQGDDRDLPRVFVREGAQLRPFEPFEPVAGGTQ
jgi:integrating conjugative element protein (TIGR03759 family)